MCLKKPLPRWQLSVEASFSEPKHPGVQGSRSHTHTQTHTHTRQLSGRSQSSFCRTASNCACHPPPLLWREETNGEEVHTCRLPGQRRRGQIPRTGEAERQHLLSRVLGGGDLARLSLPCPQVPNMYLAQANTKGLDCLEVSAPGEGARGGASSPTAGGPGTVPWRGHFCSPPVPTPRAATPPLHSQRRPSLQPGRETAGPGEDRPQPAPGAENLTRTGNSEKEATTEKE